MTQFALGIRWQLSDSLLRPNNELIMRLLRPFLVFALLNVQSVMAVDEDTGEITGAATLT